MRECGLVDGRWEIWRLSGDRASISICIAGDQGILEMDTAHE